MSMKTNVMRILDAKKIHYKVHEYSPDRTLTGKQIAQILQLDSKNMFKTLITQGKSGQYYVFVIGVEDHLDLKKAAKCVDEKSIAMIKDKELLPLTGYVHGGCSPIGMKKFFQTTFDIKAKECPIIIINAGKLGFQVELSLEDLEKVISLGFFDLAESI